MEDELLLKRLADLANIAYQRDIPQFSDFLTLNELSIYHRYVKDYTFIKNVVVGGIDGAERCMIGFIPEMFIETYETPITVLSIKPLNQKFSSELTHRDFLGSILNLGIERTKLGDILVEDNSALVFCANSMADYIITNLTRVKNTPVLVSIFENEVATVEAKYEEIIGSISSLRLDCVLSLAFNKARSKVVAYIEEGKVFVNGRIITTNSYNIKEQDVISVRGLGKLKYINTSSVTKKGRFYVKLHKYI
ncbi:MAG: RNA-binding protein [Lachnospira sp.]|nr:RNA-binding protein [Lachnospira sp.]